MRPFVLLVLAAAALASAQEETWKIDYPYPNNLGGKENKRCMTIPIPQDKTYYIKQVAFGDESSYEYIHHTAIYACEEPWRSVQVWDNCFNPCLFLGKKMEPVIMDHFYSGKKWSVKAEERHKDGEWTSLPVGKDTGLKYLVLNTHIKLKPEVEAKLTEKATVEFVVKVTEEESPRNATAIGFAIGQPEHFLHYRQNLVGPNGERLVQSSGYCRMYNAYDDSILLFSGNYHTHYRGIVMETTRLREYRPMVYESKLLQRASRTKPHTVQLTEDFSALAGENLLNGDIIKTMCIWELRDDEDYFDVGYGADDEMCNPLVLASYKSLSGEVPKCIPIHGLDPKITIVGDYKHEDYDGPMHPIPAEENWENVYTVKVDSEKMKQEEEKKKFNKFQRWFQPQHNTLAPKFQVPMMYPRNNRKIFG